MNVNHWNNQVHLFAKPGVYRMLIGTRCEAVSERQVSTKEAQVPWYANL